MPKMKQARLCRDRFPGKARQTSQDKADAQATDRYDTGNGSRVPNMFNNPSPGTRPHGHVHAMMQAKVE